MTDTNLAIDIGLHAAKESARKLMDLTENIPDRETRNLALIVGITTLISRMEAMIDAHPVMREMVGRIKGGMDEIHRDSLGRFMQEHGEMFRGS